MHENGGLLGFLDHAAALAYAIFVIGGLLGLAIRPIRGWCGLALYFASAAIGLDIWGWSIVTVHALWGTVAVIVGLLLLGVGVAPMALLATAFHGEWVTFGYLVSNLVILVLCRWAASSLLDAPRRATS
jgi:hypothetical protein